MKAYKCVDGGVRLFRPDQNMARMRNTAQRCTFPVSVRAHTHTHTRSHTMKHTCTHIARTHLHAHLNTNSAQVHFFVRRNSDNHTHTHTLCTTAVMCQKGIWHTRIPEDQSAANPVLHWTRKLVTRTRERNSSPSLVLPVLNLETVQGLLHDDCLSCCAPVQLNGQGPIDKHRIHDARRLHCEPAVSLQDFDPRELTRCIKKLVSIDRDWIPESTKCSLYVRPTLIGTEVSTGGGVLSE